MDWPELRPESEDTLNDPLDQAIRHALRQEAGRAVPPDRVWHRINSQITGGPTRPRRRLAAAPRGSFLAPLVQGLAAMVLVLLLGLNMLPYLVVEHPSTGTAVTPAPLDGASEEDEPAPSGTASQPLVPADGAVENVDTLKATLRQQQRQQEALSQPASTPGHPARDQAPATGQVGAQRNPTAAVQPAEDGYWSPPRPRRLASTRTPPQAPRF